MKCGWREVQIRLTAAILLLSWASLGYATGMETNPRLYKMDLRQLEWQSGGQSALELESWYGDAIKKWLLDIELEKESSEGVHREITAGYRQAISPFFDAGLVFRRETGDDNRNWTGVQLSGTAPYFIHTTVELLAHQGDVLLDVELEHELPLSRRWIIKTKAEYEALLTGGGPQEAEVGFRLVYETPGRWGIYVGYEWQSALDDDDTSRVAVAGLSYWF